MRNDQPLAWSDVGTGFWSLLRYDDVTAAAMNPTVFSSEISARFADGRVPPVEVDRPRHTIFRRALTRYFKPEAIERMISLSRSFADELLDPLVRAGGGDFASGFSYPYPAKVICAFLGIPVEDALKLKKWADESFHYRSDRLNRPEIAREAEKKLSAYAEGVVASREGLALDPDEDMITGIMHFEFDGWKLTRAEVARVVRLMLSAGHNNTTSSTGITLMEIARNPHVQEELRADRSLIPAAILEFLRRESPAMTSRRVLKEDLTLHGRTMKAGDEVMLFWSSANRDGAHFNNPDVIDIARDNSSIVTFGWGPHRCLGLSLALMEIRVAVEALFDRTRWVELAGEPERMTWERLGVTKLPLLVR
jgi:cytochrome P450